MAERDGIQSAILVAGGGTFDSPSSWAELKEAVDNFDVPDEYDKTQLKGRHTRDGNRSIRGARHLADEMDIDFEWDEESTLCQSLRTKFEADDPIVVAWVPYIPDPGTPAPPDDEEYIKAQYKIIGLSPKYNPGSANTRTLKLVQTKGQKSVKVIPT